MSVGTMLKSPRFLGNQRLQAAFQNNPPLTKASSGQAVRIVQQAFIDLGYQMPISTKKHGTPDGIYGDETFGVAWQFQSEYGIPTDGKVGRQTLGLLDQCLPGPPKPMPPLPNLLPYLVPGLIQNIKQPSDNSCWAAAYTMLASWRCQQSLDIDEAIARLGPKWLEMYQMDTGLPVHQAVTFSYATRLRHEPVISMGVDGWVELLRKHGLLWLVYGWQTAGPGGAITKRGRHAIVLAGMTGDGTIEKSKFTVIDPQNGGWRNIPFLQLAEEYELGYSFGGEISNEKHAGTSQILHY